MQWLALLACAALPAEALLRRAPAEEPNMYGIDAATWDGWDEPAADDQSPAPLSSANATNSTSFSTASHHGPRLQVLGLFNTGTNLVQKLMMKNFPTAHFGPGPTSFWKHAKPSAMSRLKSTLQSSGVVGVAVIRDPMSWLQSMKKAPYDLGNCVHSYNWLTASCTLPAPCSGPPASNCAQAAHQGPMTFSSVPAFWNEWTKDYDKLNTFGFQKFVVVRYEDVVLQTEQVLADIATAAGLPAPAMVMQQHAPAKTHGASNGRAAAIQKLRSKSYLRLYSPQNRKAACARLDKPLMAKHDYHDCDGQ
jgi:hypothetical protein